MKTKNFIKILAFILFGCGQIFAQSTIQEYPTAVTSNEITGKITAREVGDSRQTSHYYTFNGTQGDLFINLETSNLNADIDVFTLADLRPLTKIVVYAGSETTETGRVVFVRKDEKLLLRIKGRTPNDDAGTYRIKFAGSFVAIADSETEKVEIPTVKNAEESEIKVNSVGTKIEPKPKETPTPKETVAKKDDEKTVQTPQSISTTGKKVKPTKPIVETPKKEETPTTTTAKTEEKVKTETPKKEKPVKPKAEKKKEDTAKVEEKKDEQKSETVAKKQPTEKKSKIEKTKKPKTEQETPQPKNLENIKLIVLFKDGTKFEKKMSDVNHVGVDKGILTIITNDAQVLRYSILDVEKMTIE